MSPCPICGLEGGFHQNMALTLVNGKGEQTAYYQGHGQVVIDPKLLKQKDWQKEKDSEAEDRNGSRV